MNETMRPEQMKRIRSKLNMTQFELAIRLDCSPQAIAAWETGARPINRITALAMKHLERLRQDGER